MIAENSPSFRGGDRVPGRAPEVNWDAVISQAPQFLVSAQGEALQAMASQARAAQRLQELTEPMLRKLSPLPPGVPPSTATPKPSGG